MFAIPFTESLIIGELSLPIFQQNTSPPLNPVELVFSLAKRYIRHSPHRYNTLTFADLVQEAFSQVTNEKIQGFYHHCIHSTTPLDQQEFCNFT